MACRLMFLSAFLFAASLPAFPSVHGYGVNGTEIAQINVLGRLFCSVTGMPVPGFNTPGADGVNVDLVCKPMIGGKTSLGSAVTNSTGHFEAIVPFDKKNHNVFDPDVCYIEVGLPVANCELFPPKGVLKAAIFLFQVVDNILGAIAKFFSGSFHHMAESF